MRRCDCTGSACCRRVCCRATGSSCWLWEPGFYAGEVTAELLDEAGHQSALYLLDVAPDASKLGRDVFQTMLDDLWAVDPHLVIGSEPGTTSTGELGVIEDPWRLDAETALAAGAVVTTVEVPAAEFSTAAGHAPLTYPVPANGSFFLPEPVTPPSRR